MATTDIAPTPTSHPSPLSSQRRRAASSPASAFSPSYESGESPLALATADDSFDASILRSGIHADSKNRSSVMPRHVGKPLHDGIMLDDYSATYPNDVRVEWIPCLADDATQTENTSSMKGKTNTEQSPEATQTENPPFKDPFEATQTGNSPLEDIQTQNSPFENQVKARNVEMSPFSDDATAMQIKNSPTKNTPKASSPLKQAVLKVQDNEAAENTRAVDADTTTTITGESNISASVKAVKDGGKKKPAWQNEGTQTESRVEDNGLTKYAASPLAMSARITSVAHSSGGPASQHPPSPSPPTFTEVFSATDSGVVSDNDVTIEHEVASSTQKMRAGLTLQLKNSNLNVNHNNNDSNNEEIQLKSVRRLEKSVSVDTDHSARDSGSESDLDYPTPSSSISSFHYSPTSPTSPSALSFFQPADVTNSPDVNEKKGKKRKKHHKASKSSSGSEKESKKRLGSLKRQISLEAVVEVDPGVFEKTLSPLGQVVSMWPVFVFFLTPIILLPIFLVNDSPVSRCAYVIFVMAVYWVTEVIPIPVTSLIPVFILPMMGLVTARNTSMMYLNDTSILFLGGLTVAIAIETWNLHRRIALAVMIVVGAEPRWLMLGMMLVTWFLSMWISNTATTAMMLPIVQAVLEQITVGKDPSKTSAAAANANGTGFKAVSKGDEASKVKINGEDTPGKLESRPKSPGGEDDVVVEIVMEPMMEEDPMQLSTAQLGKALSLAIAYSANVGGIGSLTGTGPNLVLLGQSQIVFEKVGLPTPITFATWMVFGLPLSLILVFVVWIWLQVLFLRCRGACDCLFKKGGPKAQERTKKVREVIREEFKKLGPISYVSDSTPAILIAVLMFILPSNRPDVLKRQKPGDCHLRLPVKPLLDWKVVHQKMPWSLYLLLGGGFALARAASDSGLSVWLGGKLSVFDALDPWLTLLIICYIVTFFTEITSNTAIATLMMPILAQLSLTLKLNPLFFMFPVAITTSFAFMLPVATPPNAIVFAFGAIRVIDMVTAGFILNVVTVPILLLASVTWANAFFNFQTIPPEFLTVNASAAFNVTAI